MNDAPGLESDGTRSETARPRNVWIDADGVELPGALALMESAAGVVLFAHGSGSSRHSSCNQFIAEVLQQEQAEIGTLLFDLLTQQESENRRNVFDVDLLAERLRVAAEWALARPDTASLPIGLFGASTCAAAAMAVDGGDAPVRAVVSWGGRPDLADRWLSAVRALTGLIVGAEDHKILAQPQGSDGAPLRETARDRHGSHAPVR